MTIRVYNSRRVECIARAALPMSARRAWGQIRDFHRFAAHDPFHANIAIDGQVPQAGARLSIEHRYGPLRIRRVGRILKWREGVGFAYSDLSQRGTRCGFPHVMSIAVAGSDARDTSILTVRVTGRWTLPVPRWMALMWLRWVMATIEHRTRNDLLAFLVATQARKAATLAPSQLSD